MSLTSPAVQKPLRGRIPGVQSRKAFIALAIRGYQTGLMPSSKPVLYEDEDQGLSGRQIPGGLQHRARRTAGFLSPQMLPVAESGGQIAGYTIADHLESRPKTGWLMRFPAAAIEGFRGIGAEGVLPRGRTGEPRRHEQRFTADRCLLRRCPGDRKGLTLLG